jgi:prepilin-type N-terminal cleavage/methylation domain-containing protein
MKPGLSLIEVVVGLAIASILSVLLYQSTSQTVRVVKTVDVMINAHSELALFSNRIQKDSAGMFVPRFAVEKKKDKTKPEPKAPEQKSQPKPEEADQSKINEEKQREVFFLENMNITKSSHKEPSHFTFISANPLTVYGESAPRRVRISYALERQKEGKNIFKLVRYESSEVDYKKFQEKQKSKAIKGYDILTNIRQLEIQCFVPKPEVEEEKEKKGEDQKSLKQPQKKEKKKPKKIEYEKTSLWPVKEKEKKAQALLPQWIEIKGEITDARQKKEIPFQMFIPILTWNSIPKPVETQSPMARIEEILKKAGLEMPGQEGAQGGQEKEKPGSPKSNGIQNGMKLGAAR